MSHGAARGWRLRLPRALRSMALAPTALALAAVAWLLVGGGHVHAPTWRGWFGLWVVMTAAMMLPVTIPWVTALAALRPQTAGRDVMLFIGAYGAVWMLYCAVAASLQQGLARVAGEQGHLPPRLVGVVVVLIGAYQFAPIKRACLRHCRSPFGEVLIRWTSSWRWAVRVGLSHGLRCLGCCWALMALGLVTGAAHLYAMTALTVLVWIEQLAPWGERAARATGALLIGLGLALAW